MKLFIGLGNPGEKYAGNRHNIGFMAVERIARDHSFGPWRRKFQGLVAEGEIGSERVTLLKPDTFMNESGRAGGEAFRFLKIELSSVIVFHDELDLPAGKLKVKTGGGNAGHNGLRSLTAHIGNEYVRVRLGIGHPGSKDAVIHYVLGDFAKSERGSLDDFLGAIALVAPYLAKGDSARFLSEAARRIGTETGEALPAPKKVQKPVITASDKPRIVSGDGERGGKRQSAIAENLKKWLAARKGSEE